MHPTTVTALVVGSIVTGAAVWLSTRPAPPPWVRTEVTTSGDAVLSLNGGDRKIAITPDGSRIVYRGQNQLLVRALDQLEPTALAGLSAARGPFVSPDGQWVGFFDTLSLKKVAITGGPPVTLATVGGAPRGATWGEDGTIIYATAGATSLQRVSAAGGDPTVLTTLDTERGELGHYWPKVLPGGEAVLFTVVHGAGSENMELAVLDLATMEQKVLLPGGSDAQYAATGHLVYGADGTVWAVPFDLDRLEVTGDRVPVLEGVIIDDTGAVEVSLSANGTLLYAAVDSPSTSRMPVWVDRQGQEEPVPVPPRAYTHPRLSPDGRYVALGLDLRNRENGIGIWDLRLNRGRRFIADPADPYEHTYPVWTPDSSRIVFSSTVNGRTNLYWRAADGTDAVDRLTESANIQFGYSFSPDGEALVFREDQRATGSDLRVLSLAGDRGVETLLATEFHERNAELSPDGRWMVYESNQSGWFEVYVRPFPNVDDGLWQISTGGGAQPLWARNGRELFYRRGGAVMTVAVQTDPSFTPGTPEVLFEGNYLEGILGAGRNYDVAPDGQRFLMITAGGGAEGTSAAASLIVVQNWFERLRRIMPTTIRILVENWFEELRRLVPTN